MAKTRAEIVAELERLLSLALPESNAAPNERDNALRALQKSLTKHKPTLVEPQRSTSSSSQRRTEPSWEGAPPKPSGSSRIHERTERANEWRAFKKRHHIFESEAQMPEDSLDDDLCNKCGEPSHSGDMLIVSERGFGWTHKGCADWWWGFEFPEREPEPATNAEPADAGSGDDEIPF